MMATNVATGLEIEYASADESVDSSLSTPYSPRFTPRPWDEWPLCRSANRTRRCVPSAAQFAPTVIVAVNYAKVPRKRPKLCAKASRLMHRPFSLLRSHRYGDVLNVGPPTDFFAPIFLPCSVGLAGSASAEMAIALHNPLMLHFLIKCPSH